MLNQAIENYLLWMISNGYSKKRWDRSEKILKYFTVFVGRHNIPWEDIFTHTTLNTFQRECSEIWAIKGLWQYLFREGKVSQALCKPRAKLPEIYEEYLLYCDRVRNLDPDYIKTIRRVLALLSGYLEKGKLTPSSIGIGHLDAFWAQINPPIKPRTQRNYCYCLRGFLRYLYQKQRIKKDLAPLLKGARLFDQAKPPRFLRPQEVHRLFASFELSSPREIRTYAMIHLAYTLGLRPKEISLIRLDDISFSRAELSVHDRKSNNPIKLPLSEDTMKAIAAYIIGVRSKSSERALFLGILPPHGPISSTVVSDDISSFMRRANLPSSAYWLRHTYAQNLLEAGVSIFEIKQMLGHEKIRSTQHYIHVHIKLMREVLFNETL